MEIKLGASIDPSTVHAELSTLSLRFDEAQYKALINLVYWNTYYELCKKFKVWPPPTTANHRRLHSAAPTSLQPHEATPLAATAPRHRRGGATCTTRRGGR